jgi:hypothetical protein
VDYVGAKASAQSAGGVEDSPYGQLRFDVFDNHSSQVELTGMLIWWREASVAWLAMRIRNVGRGPALLGQDLADVWLRLLRRPLPRTSLTASGFVPLLHANSSDQVHASDN